MEERIILLLDMDAFFAAIEERENPHFKGKPIVVGADPKEGKGRGVVSTCNYEARTYGIHSALPISEAYRLCPQAVFLPVNGALYAASSQNIMEILRKYASLIDQVSLDEAYLDISFAITYKKAKELAENIKGEILKKEKLVCSCGIGPNKMIAKIACEKAKPNGVLVVNPKKVQEFLSPLDIQEISGVGPKAAEKLKKFFGVEQMTIQKLKKASKKDLQALFGVMGQGIYERARGRDNSPVKAEQQVKSIGKEHTFQQDTRDGEHLLSVFRKLASEVIKELKKENFSFKTITVVCRFQGFETHTKSKTFKVAFQDYKMFEREATRLLLKFLVENLKPVRLIGVRVNISS